MHEGWRWMHGLRARCNEYAYPRRCLPMVACPNIPNLLSLCFVFSFLCCFLFYVINLGCDVSAFSYASLLELKKSKLFYRGDIVVESSLKPCRTLRIKGFLCK